MIGVIPAHSLRRRLHGGLPARVSSLALLLQRSPLLKLLPEARVLSTSGFSETVRWTVMAVAGLGAFDSVSGASEIKQLQPASGSVTISAVAGDSLNFVFQSTGTPHIPASFSISGELPPGMTHTRVENSALDSISGTPAVSGTYPITVTAWELPGDSGDFLSQAFTFTITNPPLPEITAQPAGGNFANAALVSLAVQQVNGRTFIWKRNGEPLELQDSLLFARSAARRFRVAPPADPGDAWRGGAPFNDSAWASVSTGVGYDNDLTAVDYTAHFTPAGDVKAAMSGLGKPAAVHLRLPFTVTGSLALSYFKLRVQCDDGFVAWLNGTEIASLNKPAVFQWNSAAGRDAADATAITFREFDVSAHLGLLRQGNNLLAVQAMNSASTSPDFLFNCELEGGINSVNSPRLVLTSLLPDAGGEYTLDVANPASSVPSAPAAVYVLPVIVQEPASVSVDRGTVVQFNVTPDGSPPFSYQWYEGQSGDITHPIAGAVDETLFTAPLTTTAAFWVRVTNPAGFVDSNTATASINAPTAEDFSHWVAARFSPAEAADPAIAGPDADPDGDGLTNTHEYVFGTAPLTTVPLPGFSVVSPSPLSFTAAGASGPGYGGRTRLFTIESAAGLTNGPWQAVPGFSGIQGHGQTVTLTDPVSVVPVFYRLRVQLLP